MPDHAEKGFQAGTYSPWYVGHHESAKLNDAAIQSLYRYWIDNVDQSDSGDIMEFMGWLEDFNRPDWEGYIVLNSGPEGYCKLETA